MDARPGQERNFRERVRTLEGQPRHTHRDGATALGDEVVVELLKAITADDRLSRRQEMAEHFWCSLLAALADALQGLRSRLNDVPEAVITFLLQLPQFTSRATREAQQNSCVA